MSCHKILFVIMYPLRICLRNPKIETKLLLLFFYSGLAFILMRMCKNKYL